MRRAHTPGLSLVLALALGLCPSLVPQSASATTQTRVPVFGVVTQLKVVEKSRVSRNYINTRQEIGSCRALSAGVGCAINHTASATRSINLALGISRSVVAGSLGISASDTRSVGVTCNAPELKRSQRLVAYPAGDRYRYKVNKMTARSGVILSNTTSGWLYAFDPHPAGMACRIV